MPLFLRFYIDLEFEMQNPTSLDWIGATRQDAGIGEDAAYDSYGQKIIENQDGVWSVIPGLCGHLLESKTLDSALNEIKTKEYPYGDFSQKWAIFIGEPVKRLIFGDGWAFNPTGILYIGK